MRCLRLLAFLTGVFAACGLTTGAYAVSRICMSADSLSFGQRPVGSSESATVVVSNCGDAPFAFTDVSRHTATNVAYRTQTSCSTGMTLAPGAQCAASVYFEPTVPGQASGALWFHNTTSTPDQLLTFYGRGVDAQAGTASLVFSPAIANFGDAAVGRETAPLVLTLQNAGTAPLVPSALVLNGRDPYDFRGETGTGASSCGIGRAIAPGAGCTLILYFHPQASGARQANLVVDAPQLAALAVVTLAGDGMDA
ncbi:MAG TPA: choice-of-anchor D domain-containing protein, partial [Casimicrobiaceae bacterium]|nr:choice-of-anchor D domain-containing protein [Casimicrobiaceae bacterium]